VPAVEALQVEKCVQAVVPGVVKVSELELVFVPPDAAFQDVA